MTFGMKVEQNRRDFLITKLSAGFAAAVLPISAATITTDASGLLAGEVQIPTKDGRIPAYRAMPTDNGTHSFRWFWWCRKFSAFTNT